MPAVVAIACDAPGMLFCHMVSDRVASARNSCGTIDAAPAAPVATVCPETAPAPATQPGVDPAHRTAAYWIERSRAHGDPDAVLMTPADIADHDRALRQGGAALPFTVYDLDARIDVPGVRAELASRFSWLGERFASKAYVGARGESLTPIELGDFDASRLPAVVGGEVRAALADIELRCAPTLRPYYTPALDLRFDRNRCSAVHAQAALQVLAQWPGDLLLVRTRFAYGWIPRSAPLSPILAGPERAAFVSGPTASVVGERTLSGDGLTVAVPDGTLVPIDATGAALFATRDGVHRSAPLPVDALRPTARPLTRRALLEEAFRYLETPYGWGGTDGGRDCSRFLLDVFAAFDLELPRHSAAQAAAGTFSIDVSKMASERERLLLIDAAAERGVVLLHFPGHIMLYLGRTEDGRAMAIHSFAEYLVPCAEKDPARPDGTETLLTVDRIRVTDLELGRGTSRTAFVERMTRISVLGQPPGVALQGVAELRPASPPMEPERCTDSQQVAIFRSPMRPHADQPVRFIATTQDDPGPVRLDLLTPSGDRLTPPLKRLGGPPFSYVVQVDKPEAGRWKVLFGDGQRTLACFAVNVSARPPPLGDTQAAWPLRRAWGEATENLFAAWVESLFDYAGDSDLTWSNLQTLLQDRDHNLLFDHYGAGEDGRLRLEPDCADLPYLLRAYFAWKLGLPFGYRQCSRGRTGRPPRCGAVTDNLIAAPMSDAVDAFGWFANRKVRSGVHSASGRTAPQDDATDAYPVALSRNALTAGTPYADPYGHLLVVAKWVPQGTMHYGEMIAADAQPDGTIGRRRFWRGTFLFSPETKDVGAGFKAWRPLVWDREAGALQAVPNEDLRGEDGLRPFSREQYEVSVDDFYVRMEGLINPRPLDALVMQRSLVDALDEAVARRIVSIQNGLEFQGQRGWSTIEMPKGYAVFETVGAWEDFSTPARDMRLLIALDTVLRFVDDMRRAPDRFGLGAAEVETAAARVSEARDRWLTEKTFRYTRSDGTAQVVRLIDLIHRKADFEMAYNPNDCAEIRWAAPEGSPERSTCRRHAPAAQTERMSGYRPWFQARRRPPR